MRDGELHLVALRKWTPMHDTIGSAESIEAWARSGGKPTRYDYWCHPKRCRAHHVVSRARLKQLVVEAAEQGRRSVWLS
jgi:hypothetical protein